MPSLRCDAGCFISSIVVVMVVCGAATAADKVGQDPFAGPAGPQAAGGATAGFAPASGRPALPSAAPSIYPQVHLQQPSRSYRTASLAVSAAEARAREMIDAALQKGCEDALEFTDMPLRDVVRTLGERWNVPIRIDRKSLDEAGIDPETSITNVAVKGETLRGVLQTVLDDIDLAWVVRGERLVITTKEAASGALITRLYPLPLGTANQPVDFQALIDTITNTTGAPADWADQGGNGQIWPAEGGEPLLVITQTEAMHGEIEALLRGMHDRALAEFLETDGQPRQTPVVRIYRCADKAVRDELVASLAGLCNASLAADADRTAKVAALAEHVVVQSVKPGFHALAAQVVAATIGVRPAPTPDGVGQARADVVGPARPGAPAMPPAPPLYPQVHLQRPSRGYRTAPLAASAPEARSRQAIDEALRTGHEQAPAFDQMPLRDVVKSIAEAWGVPIRIDHRSLDAAGIDAETPISHLGTKGESLRGVLQAVLDTIDLTWQVRGERLVITTKEQAETLLTTRLYPLPLGTAKPPVDFQSLIDMITNTIGGPAAWADQGGNGQIRPFDGGEPLLVIMQTEAMHGEIEALLRGMHDRALAEFLDTDGQPRRTPVVRIYRCADKDVRTALVASLAALCNASLADGDPAAKVMSLAEHVVVQSAKPDFHALAAQIVAATAGVRPLPPRPTPGPGFIGAPQPFPPEGNVNRAGGGGDMGPGSP